MAKVEGNRVEIWLAFVPSPEGIVAVPFDREPQIADKVRYTLVIPKEVMEKQEEAENHPIQVVEKELPEKASDTVQNLDRTTKEK